MSARKGKPLLNSLSPSPNGEGFRVRCSTLLEDIASPQAQANGFDIADYMIEELKSNNSIPRIQSCFSPSLQSMVDKNKALLFLIDKLGLIEII